MNDFNRLNVADVVATLTTGAEVNIGEASEADRKRLRRACRKAGFVVAIVKCGFGYVTSRTPAQREIPA